MTTSLEKVQLTTLLARKPPPRTKPGKKRLQQLKKDRERTAAHHREALLGRLEPSVLRDSMAKRNAIVRLGRRWFHGESEAVRQAYFAGRASPRTSALARSSGGPMESQNLAGEVVAARRLRRVRVNPHQRSVRLHDGMHAAAKYGRRP